MIDTLLWFWCSLWDAIILWLWKTWRRIVRRTWNALGH